MVISVFKQAKHIFKQGDPTQTVAITDVDIVKMASLAWSERKKLNFSRGFILTVIFLSLITLTTQMMILGWLSIDVTDVTFCGDVVRYITNQKGTLTKFFKNDGNDTLMVYKELWDYDYTDAAKAEIATERQRLYASHYMPTCDADNFYNLKY